MIIIGELINTSRPEVNEAVENRDEQFFIDLAQAQEAAGATYVDVNAGSRIHDEVEILTWLIELVQENVEAPLCIDSPNHLAIEAALKVYKGEPMVNSITAEKERIDQLLPILKEYKPRIVALCMDDTGMPSTAEQRLAVADVLAELLTDAGIPEDYIFFDPLVKPMSVDDTSGLQVLDSVKVLREKYPNMHITSGLSNISYGLPSRTDINQAFLMMCMDRGMDSAIIDPLDERMMTLIKSAEVVLGRDTYCKNYLKYQMAKKKK